MINEFEFLENKDFTDEVIDNQEEDSDTTISISEFPKAVLYGVDWTVETIVSQINKGNLLLNPEFQRRDAWSVVQKSKYIESIFLGLPTPQIILAEKKGTGKYIVIDGKQRLLTLLQFFIDPSNTDYAKLTLRGLPILVEFNGKTIEDLEKNSEFADNVRFFQNQTIRTIVIRDWPSEQFLNTVFSRINTGSLKLSPQELRQALFPGKFVNLINKLSDENTEIWDVLKIKSPDPRMRDVELVLRFFAFKFYLKFYTGGFSNFLDDVCKRGNKNFENNSDTFINIGNELNNAVKFTVSIFGENSFRNFSKDGYETRFNRAVFDIFVYYFSDKNLRKLTKLKMHDVRQEFEELCISDEKFQESIGLSTKSPKYTFYRIRAWGLKLSKIVEYKIEDIPNQNDK